MITTKDYRQPITRGMITITLEYEVEEQLTKLIKPEKRSSFVNSLLREALKEKAIEELNNQIRSIKRVKPLVTSVEGVRALRENRFNRLAEYHRAKSFDE